jgi:hypothetical protein
MADPLGMRLATAVEIVSDGAAEDAAVLDWASANPARPRATAMVFVDAIEGVVVVGVVEALDVERVGWCY